MVCLSVFALLLLPLSLAAPASHETRQLSPSVQLPYATVVGTSVAGIDSFRGIPYAQPPVGQLRLKPPQSITSNLGTVQATGIPRACPQFLLDTSSLTTGILGQLLDTPFLQVATDSGEDCLTINVHRPSNFRSTQIYDASDLILTSMAQSKEIIYVAVNYRVSGFGFMPGSAILADGSSNLGLLDQRFGLQWVADNIARFGGDPSKVTIWGESAGSVSVFDQMAIYDGINTYKGKPLFRAAIMDSGSIIPSDPVDCPKGEAVYNTVVQNAGCSGASDTLECLRGVNYTTFLSAVNSAPSIFDYSGIAISYQPRPDGRVLTASPELLVMTGKYAKIPFIIGDQEDEGTLFSLTQTNLTTTTQLATYLNTYLLQDATPAQILAFVDLYPDNPSAGSPFRTGPLNNIYPQYKRLAAIAGDITFNLARRIFLNSSSIVAPSVPSWSYLASYDYDVPVLGTFHASDIAPAYGETPGFPSTTIQSYYLSFVNTLNPNTGTAGGLPNWPLWSAGRELMNFGELGNALMPDTFRDAAAGYIAQMGKAFYF